MKSFTCVQLYTNYVSIYLFLRNGGYNGTSYYFTHMRISPWLIGLVFGSILWGLRNKTVQLKQVSALGCCIMQILSLLTTLTNGKSQFFSSKKFYSKLFMKLITN